MKNLGKFFVFLFALTAIFFVSGFMGNNFVLAADKVNINTANVTELDAIPEVGPATAAKIIAYREAHGPFVKIEDIMKVSGIKQATFDKMKDYITVGDDLGGGDEASTSTATSTDNTGDTGTTTATSTVVTTTATSTGLSNNAASAGSGNGSGIVSVHYVQEELSDYVEPTTFEVSAGRDRLAYINSPVSFVAKYKVSKDLNGKSCSYTWSFGDGASQTGEKVQHIYKYAGDYNVVVNGKCNDLNSVSRTAVKVLASDLAITKKSDGSVEIWNQGKYEINLFGWRIQTPSQAYVFPLDTIISAGQGVIIPPEYSKISAAGTPVVLVDASSKLVAQTIPEVLTADLAGDTDSRQTISVAEFDKFVLEYKKLTQNHSPVLANDVRPNISLSASVASVFVNSPGATGSAVLADDTVDATATPAEEPPARGFWSKLFHPIRTIQEAFYK